MEAKAVVDILAETLRKAKYGKPLDTLCNVDTVVERLGKAETEKPSNSMGHDEAKAQNDTLAIMLVQEESETLCETL